MVVILNARAGSVLGKRVDMQSKIAALFGAAGVQPNIIAVVGPKHLSAVARQAAAGAEETIVAGGGDGNSQHRRRRVSR